jgi:hypothetical protein
MYLAETVLSPASLHPIDVSHLKDEFGMLIVIMAACSFVDYILHRVRPLGMKSPEIE